jgi:hypothetical protein
MIRKTLKTKYLLGFKKASAQLAASNDFTILTRFDEFSAWSGLQWDDDAVPRALSKKASQSAVELYVLQAVAPDQLHLTSSFYDAIHNRQLRIIYSPLLRISVADVLKHGADGLLGCLLAKQQILNLC